METIETSNIPAEQLAGLDAYAQTTGIELRAVLLHVTRCVRSLDGRHHCEAMEQFKIIWRYHLAVLNAPAFIIRAAKNFSIEV